MWCSVADTHLKLLDRVVSDASLLSGVSMSVTLHIVDLWRYYVCCTRSGVTRCTLYMMLYLSRMCRCVLHAVLWSHFGTLMRLLATELAAPQDFYSTSSISVELSWWPRIRWCGTGGFQEQSPLFFYWPSCSLPFCFLLFSLLFFHSMGWYCGDGVFGLICCYLLSPGLSLPTFFNNKNNINNMRHYNTASLPYRLPHHCPTVAL